MIVVVKVGTSSITADGGSLDTHAIRKLCAEIAAVRADGHQVVLVSSAAIAAGMSNLALDQRPRDFASLQALSAVGQIQLMKTYDAIAGDLGMGIGQVLVAPPDFFDRARYLRARSCLEQLLQMGVLPIVNENDAVADDAIRFGDNDRIAALVAHLVGADLLVLLTDTPGVLTADPRIDSSASLIEEIVAIDHDLEQIAGASASEMSQGGMASKLSAAKIASWSGIRSVIGAAHRDDVLADAIAGVPGAGTAIVAREANLSARKLWIAFGVGSTGSLQVDGGAQDAIIDRGTSLLPVGVTGLSGTFEAGAAVEIKGPGGEPFAKGLTRMGADEIDRTKGLRSSDVDVEGPAIVIHRDDLVVLP